MENTQCKVIALLAFYDAILLARLRSSSQYRQYRKNGKYALGITTPP